jgi:hypothetical protein
MIAGHTKFAPDRLFSITGSAYKSSDVFNINDLNQICGLAASSTFIEDGSGLQNWRDFLGEKYSALPGVRKLHDFLIVRMHDDKVMMKVRERIFGGVWTSSPLRVVNPTVQLALTSYGSNRHPLSKEKLTNMALMYDKYIPPRFRSAYLPSNSATPNN